MTLTRIAVAAGIAVLTAFVIVVVLEGHSGAGAAIVALVAIAALVGAGNALYGRRSHYKAVVDRSRPAQEAHDHAADLAAEARRATAEAARKGERYCPLDPALRETQHQQPTAGT
ncbi:MAG TPA: hypothetical protein VHD39_00920 [Acidimicrobiales bacterium]|nr:hypothetical protein [Acidimicrobiales bacterium]